MPTVTLLHGQRQILFNKTKPELAIIAGVGSGKTSAGPKACLIRCVDNPQSEEFLVIAPTNQLARDRCLKEFESYLLFLGMREGREFKVYRSPGNLKIELFLPGCVKQTGYFLSGESPERIVSYNVFFVWIDEPALQVADVWTRTAQRLRCPKANYIQTLFTGTPEGVGNWFADRFSEERAPQVGDTRYRENDTVLILEGSSYDNPFLPDSFFEALEAEFAHDPAAYETYVLGKFVSLAKKRFYFSFDERRNVRPHKPDPNNKQLYLTWDNNPVVLAWVAFQPVPDAYAVVRDNNATGRNIEDACVQFVEAFPPATWGGHVLTVLGDPALHARSTHSYSTGYEIVRTLLKPHYPRLSIEAPRGTLFVEERSRTTNKALHAGRVFADPGATGIIRSWKTVETNEKGQPKKEGGEDRSHCGEALDFALGHLAPPFVRREYAGLK